MTGSSAAEVVLPRWQQSLKEAYRNSRDLLKALDLDPLDLDPLDLGPLGLGPLDLGPLGLGPLDLEDKGFPLLVPKSFAANMEKGNPHDPLLRQVLISPAEKLFHVDERKDPLQEASQSPMPGLIHKYRHRLLLVLSTGCPIHCRYCFRKHFPYENHGMNADQRQRVLRYIVDHVEVQEVIFSGGDPLLLSDQRLASWVDDLARIKHIKTLRWHTRFPVVLPERMTSELASIMQHPDLKTLLVLHSNHPNEISSSVQRAIDIWREVQKTRVLPGLVLNQSVLLKGVNDDAKTLAALSHRCFDAGILPYYLHQLDPVQGSRHFDVPILQAKRIYQQLQAILPGYLVPKWVQEKPFVKYKVILGS